MDTYVFLAVLVAALVHAGWNSVVKARSDRLSILLVLTLVHAAIAAPLLVLAPAPAAEAIPYIVASAFLHTGYKLFLAKAYGHADLSQAYPLSRGTAPLLVFLFSVLVLGEAFELVETTAILAISAGIFLIAREGGSGGHMGRKALGYAIGTAVFIAGYTTVDGVGVRVAGTPTGYLCWMVMGDAITMVACALLYRGPTAFKALATGWKSGVGAGAASFVAYWIVMWAFTLAPIALVAALRESSILFATIIAALILNERVGAWRWASASLIAVGVILIRL